MPLEQFPSLRQENPLAFALDSNCAEAQDDEGEIDGSDSSSDAWRRVRDPEGTKTSALPTRACTAYASSWRQRHQRMSETSLLWSSRL